MSERKNLYLIGEINKEKLEYIYNESMNGNKFNLHIFSEGGCFDSTIAIINLLKNKDVKAYGNSKIYSAAALIFISMNVRYLYHNSFVSLHDIHISELSGRSQDLSEGIKHISRQYEIMKKIVKDNSKLNSGEIEKILTSEKYLDASECLEMDICEAVIHDS